jgi:primosomal protein N' (replication factor Y)
VPAVSRRRFDYAVPERWRADVRPGTRVRVPFHGRRVGAWVVECDVTPPSGVVLRELTGVSGWGPPPEVLELAEWGAWRWAMPLATLLRAASPERNVRTLPRPPGGTARRHDGQGRAYGAPLGGGEGTSDRSRRALYRAAATLPARTTLRRLPPAEDLLDAVLEVVAASERCGTSALVLVPSRGWAERLAARLRSRGVDVASSWAEAAAGWPVVVGSRAAAWAPVPRLGAAVVLDAHDYEDRYDASEVVAERARRAGAPCVLVSPCPTAVQRVRYGPPEVPERAAERAGWPAVRVVDRRSADPRTGLLSEDLVHLARRVLSLGERLVCVLNRTGRARLSACASCGALVRCAVCGRAVESTLTGLRCRGCGAERPVVCAECGSLRMKVLRQGVARVREELEALLGVGVGEVSGRAGDQPVPDDRVLVGTEAVLHRVRHAGAVVFLDFDQHLCAPRFSAGEEALALLVRAGRLVGGRDLGGRRRRGAGPGVVMVQTRLPDHDVLRAAVAGDPGLFTELELRRELRLPPFSALATLKADALGALAACESLEVSSLGAGRWLLRAPDHRTLCDAVAAVHGGVRVDPRDV